MPEVAVAVTGIEYTADPPPGIVAVADVELVEVTVAVPLTLVAVPCVPAPVTDQDKLAVTDWLAVLVNVTVKLLLDPFRVVAEAEVTVVTRSTTGLLTTVVVSVAELLAELLSTTAPETEIDPV